MGTEVTNWQEELAKSAKEVANKERPAVSQIGLRAGIMMYQGQAIPGNKLDVIILSSAVEYRYDTKSFDPNNITPPDCFALSLDGEDMVPNDSAVAQQAPTCAECPMSKWTPNPKKPGKNHKPCKEKRRLALLPADVLKTGNAKTAELALLNVPTTSIKNWATFVNTINAEYARPPWAMVAEISAAPHMTNQFEVKFKPLSPIPDEFLGEIRARIAAAEAQLLTPYDSSGLTVPGSDPMKPAKERKF